MNKSVLIIMGGALLAAILVAVVVQMKLSPRGDAAPDTVQILVTKKNMFIGDTIKPENVAWKSWPEGSTFKGMVKKSDYPDGKEPEVYDAPLRRNLEKGEPVTKQALIPDAKGSNSFLAASISPGMRAMSVSVKANTMAGGFVSPGDRVDVVLSYTPSSPDGTSEFSDNVFMRYASQTVLRDIRVLAVDQRTDEDGVAKVAKTVTLELSPEQAEIMSIAVQMGDITLALRRIGEKDDPDMKRPIVTDVRVSEVLRLLQEARAKGVGTLSVVRSYGGTKVEDIPVRMQPAEEPPQKMEN
jgi:pilus assembly protein CpaB